MTSRIDSINITASNPDELGAFWRQLLNLREDPDNPNEPGDTEIMFVTEPIRVAFLFQPTDEGRGFPRIHFDVDALDRSRDDEVERLLGLGAELVADRRKPDGSGWVTLRDPDGYEICVQRSEEERRTADGAPGASKS